MLLNKQDLLNESVLKTESVTLDDGNEIIVSEIGAVDYIKLWADAGSRDMAAFTAALLSYAIVDEQGQRVFSDDDVPAISRMPLKLFMTLAEAARRINGLTGEEAKNSDPSQTDGSSSDSV